MKPIKLRAADIEIIRCLQEDARIPIARIADRLHVPESTVRHRVNRLMEQRIVEVVLMTNPLQLGYHVWVLMQIQVEMPKIRLVAQRLAEASEVYFVHITTGSYDILVGALFRSNDHLLDFITNRLAKIPGIVRTATSTVLEVVKRTLTFGLPQVMESNGQPVKRSPKRAARGRRNELGAVRVSVAKR
ncbi:MAG: Lrp/AsnC family transcriptional regulator [Candidatus Rokubacteria bacterium]|nr:Lrp/AsnC family transcriptional regulator [Candidatus Rokubacteria bacterium]